MGHAPEVGSRMPLLFRWGTAALLACACVDSEPPRQCETDREATCVTVSRATATLLPGRAIQADQLETVKLPDWTLVGNELLVPAAVGRVPIEPILPGECVRPERLAATGTPAGVGPVKPGDRLEGGVDGVPPVRLTIGAAE